VQRFPAIDATAYTFFADTDTLFSTIRYALLDYDSYCLKDAIMIASDATISVAAERHTSSPLPSLPASADFQSSAAGERAGSEESASEARRRVWLGGGVTVRSGVQATPSLPSTIFVYATLHRIRTSYADVPIRLALNSVVVFRRPRYAACHARSAEARICCC